MKIVQEKDLVEKLMDFIRECDGDELAMLAQTCFGGSWEFTNNMNDDYEWLYKLESDELYNGAFDDEEDYDG